MSKTILITGATDGIGRETAKALVQLGHRVLVHGRSASKLEETRQELSQLAGNKPIEIYRADLSTMTEVETLAAAVSAQHATIDVLINNAGVFKVAKPVDEDGMDVRFLVNTIAPYVLTQGILPLIPPDGRVINLSSAAQASVNAAALCGNTQLADGEAYAQSKLAITQWSFHLANTLPSNAPAIIAVNPGSFLASKMVKDAYGSTGNDLQIGVEAIVRAALSAEFSGASGKYFDNDKKRFASPHSDALDKANNERLVESIEKILIEGSLS